MKWDMKTLLLVVGLVILVGLGLFWVAMDLRKDRPPVGPAGAAAPSTAPPAESTSAELQEGIDAIQAGENELARELLRKVPREDPGFTLALHNRGIAEERLGNLPGALQAYGELARIQPDNPGPWVSLSWIHYLQGRYAEAELSTLRSLELAPSQVQPRYNIALFRIAQGSVDVGIRSYSRALQRDPQRALAARAQDRLQELGEKQPDLPAAQYALAFFANQRGDRAEEVEYLNRFLAMEPTGPVADTARKRLADAQAVLGSGEPGN